MHMLAQASLVVIDYMLRIKQVHREELRFTALFLISAVFYFYHI